MQEIKERVPVVTAFLYQGGKVALLKRSDKVGTYRGAWAGFSGYIEQLPLDQARQEIYEEAGVVDGDCRLSGIGIPTPVDDIENEKQWLVFPFLFNLNDGVEIETDWETEEWGWFSPDELHDLQTVPGLKAVFQQVWPPFGDQEFWDGLGEIATNTEFGATELARRGLNVLGAFVQSNWDDLNHRRLLRAIRAFASVRPTMGVFPNLTARLLLGIERDGGQYDFDELLTELISALEDSTDLSIQTAADALRDKRHIFTLSYSEAVRDTLIQLRGGIEVLIAESAPGLEGLRLAEHLRDQGISFETVSDKDIVTAVGRSDAVLVGCDAITEGDELINKVGTRTAVAAAKEAGIPAFAVAQTVKIMPAGWPVFLERQKVEGKQGGEVIFDVTPLEMFDAILTEEGPISRERIAEIRSELGSTELLAVEMLSRT